MIFAEMRDLRTKWLLLRRFTVDDAPAVYQNYASHDQVTKYLTWAAHFSVRDSSDYLNSVVQGYQTGKRYEWAIVPQDNGEIIGSINIHRIREKEDDLEVGYCLGEDFWHQGIASEALVAVIEFIKQELKPKRIFAGHNINNIYSGAVMRKCGLKFFKRMHDGHDNQGPCTVDIYELFL